MSYLDDNYTTNFKRGGPKAGSVDNAFNSLITQCQSILQGVLDREN